MLSCYISFKFCHEEEVAEDAYTDVWNKELHVYCLDD
jgi:hypothetical protein